MIKQLVVFLVICIVSINSVSAQSLQLDYETRELFDQYQSYHVLNDRQSGWAVLVFNQQDRRNLDEMLVFVRKKYKNIPYEWWFESPYYKLRIGAFRTRLEAMRFSQSIKKDFSYRLEVRADIKKVDFLKQAQTQ